MKSLTVKCCTTMLLVLFFSVFAVSQVPVPGYYRNEQQRVKPLSMTKFKTQYQYGRAKLHNKALSINTKGTLTSSHFLTKTTNKSVKPAPNPNEYVIGNTRYDKQTNGTMQNRIVLFDDGTIGATWTMGFSETNFPDRGTGYNYYDGANWQTEPTARIENTRTGWPSMAQWGMEGEIIVTHNGNNGLEICKRPVKGTGNWSESLFQGPTGSPGLSWPRVITNGPGHNQIHLVALTTPVGNGGAIYNGQDGALVYSRSLNGGQTWDIHNVQLNGTGSQFYVGLGGDTYTWAEPKGDTLALVVGDKWFDVFLLKSTDNGETWTKTMIYQHPFPFYEENHTIIEDTIWVCDGGMAIQLDNDGKANVFFGLMRVNNPDTTDEEFSYWYMTDGIAFWKEGDPELTCIEADSLYNDGHLVGWMQDLNGNDTIYEELSGIPAYTYSTTGMPTVNIDETGDIYLVMSSEMEGFNNGIQNYRHILVRKWDHNSGEWGDFYDVTDNIIHNFHECIFPIMASRSDNFIHFLYQADEEPGLAVSGDEDPYTDNYIYYSKLAKSEFVGTQDIIPLKISVSQNYPNPCFDNTSIMVTLDKTSPLQVKITDVSGRVLWSKNYGKSYAGNYLVELDVSSYRPGLYLYTVIAGDEIKTMKMNVK